MDTFDNNSINRLLGDYQLKLIDYSSMNQKLYHYTSVASLYSIVEKGELWATHARFMNDAEEGNYFWKVLSKAIEIFEHRLADEKILVGPFSNFLTEVISKKLNNPDFVDMYIISFSTMPDSLTMWNYYGKNDGYCIVMEPGKLFGNSLASNMPWAHEVIYSEHEQIDILLLELTAVYKWFCKDTKRMNEFNYKLVFERLMKRWSIYSAFFKHPSFANENELRFVFFGAQLRNTRIEYRVYQGNVTPYIRIPYASSNIPFEDSTYSSPMQKALIESPIVEITVGPLTRSELAIDGLRRWLLSKFDSGDGILQILLSQSKVPLRF